MRMPRKTFVFSLVFIGLLLLQVTAPIGAANSLLTELGEPAGSAAESPPLPYVPVGALTSFKLNYSFPYLSFGVSITQPGAYSVNASFKVESAQLLGLDYGIDVRIPSHMWIPQLGDYADFMLESLDDAYWYDRIAGSTSSYYEEFVAVYPDALVLYFEILSPTSIDLLSVNFTVSQIYSFASAPVIPLGANGTLQWTEDDTWRAARFTLPSNGLYNFTAYAGLDWTTTAGWPGGTVYPFDRARLIDLLHGEMSTYDSWNPAFSVPPGPGAGSALQTYGWYLDCFAAGDYYLVGTAAAFEYLNGTALNFTLNIRQVPTLSLAPNSAVQLSFSTTANIYDAYVAVSAPQGYYHDLYFETPAGANWSVFAWDAVQGWPTGPYLQHTRDATQISTYDERLERSWSTVPFTMMGLPTQYLIGNPYTEEWRFQGTYKMYNNGSLWAALPPGGALPPPTSRFNTYFLRVMATPSGGPHTNTFNVSLALDATAFLTLTTSGLTVSFNTTSGVFYHILQIPETSGRIYAVSANATKYTFSGEIAVEDMFGPAYYADWQWLPFFLLPLGKANPSGWNYGTSYNVSGPVTLHYAAVRDGPSYLMIHGPGMPMVGGDMTEAKVSLTVTPPTTYTLGDDVTLSLHNQDFRTYSLPLIAGYRYSVSLSMDWDGLMALGYFFNDLGYTPFTVEGIMPLLIAVMTEPVMMGIPFGVHYHSVFTARETGTMTFAVVGDGAVHFSVDVIDGIPPTVRLDLLIAAGGIIAAAIICFLLGWTLKGRRRR